MSEQISNPLLAKFKLPGRIFQLPSRGLFYTHGELAPEISEAEIHIHPMSAFDEISMKNPDMLFSGKAISQVFGTCIPDIKLPTELYGKDIDALMLYLRLVTYGPNYDITVTHTCDIAKPHSHVVDLEQVLQRMNYLDPTMFDQLYKLPLDNGQIVELQPIKYIHILDILRANEGKKELSADDLKNNLIMNLLNVIKAVDGIEDKALIRQWIEVAPAPFATKIAEAIEKTNEWGPNTEIEIKCKDCGEIFTVELPINPISFFS
jgi:hypothetical protein